MSTALFKHQGHILKKFPLQPTTKQQISTSLRRSLSSVTSTGSSLLRLLKFRSASITSKSCISTSQQTGSLFHTMSQQQQQQQQKQQAPESCAASVLQADGNFSHDLEWATKPPFALEDPSKPKPEVKYSGSCHCKEVTFELLNEPIDAHFCHCDVCQKLHGSAAHWSCIMEKKNVLFTCHVDSLSFYRTEDQSNKRQLPLKITCKRCHAPICDEGRNMMLMYPSLIDFEDLEHREPFMPRRHIFYSFRCIDVPDKMDKWAKMPGQSEKMEEHIEHCGKRGVAGFGSRPQDKNQ